MAKKYKTISGDTWDRIAKEVYGDESYTSFLMENNQKLLDYFIFPSGISLVIEELPKTKGISVEWRD